MATRVKLAASGRGGRREGAGRKPGSGNKRLAQKAIDEAKATGILPHEFLLKMVRGEPILRTITEDDGSEKVIVEKYEMKDRLQAARDAAPYYAPKMSTVEVISGVADDDLDSIIASLAAEAGVSLGNVGKEPQAETPPAEGSRPGGSSRTLLQPD